MRVDLEHDGSSDRIVVHDLDRELDQAIRDLFFREESASYVKEFPAGSVTRAILGRMQDALPAMLRQTARLETAPWEDALLEVVRRLRGLDWWLTGSGALAVRGLAVTPRDLDLVVGAGDAPAVAASLDDALVEPAVETEEWFSRWFGRAWLGARVEWVAGVTTAADEPEPTDFGLVAASRLERVRWDAVDVRVPPLDLQRSVSARRGLPERVALIDAFVGAQSRSDRSTDRSSTDPAR